MSANRNGFDVLTQRKRQVRSDQIFQVTQRASPLVVSIPHSGTWVPSEALNHLRPERFLLQDNDLYTDQVYARVAALGSSISTQVLPYVANLNRNPANIRRPVTVPTFLFGQPVLRLHYTAAQQRQILERYFWSYHRALKKLIARARAQFGFALLVDGHSLNPVGGPYTKDPGSARADITLGDCHGDSIDPALSSVFSRALQRTGWSISHNKPYAGGFITQRNGNPVRGVHAIQIEVNKALYLVSAGRFVTSTQLQPARLIALQKGLAAAVQVMLERAYQSYGSVASIQKPGTKRTGSVRSRSDRQSKYR